MIKVQKLIKRFGPKVVLRGLDFSVDQGEFVALLGPNGAGKTTFLRILASLSRPSFGEVHVAVHVRGPVARGRAQQVDVRVENVLAVEGRLCVQVVKASPNALEGPTGSFH